MRKNPRRTVAVPPPSTLLLQWLVLVAAVVAVAAVANSSNGVAETVDNAAPDAEESANDGGGVLDAVIPFRAMQLYNAVAGYLEYFYDVVIAPITGNIILATSDERFGPKRVSPNFPFNFSNSFLIFKLKDR